MKENINFEENKPAVDMIEEESLCNCFCDACRFSLRLLQ